MTASYHPPAPIPPENPAQQAALLPWIEGTPLVYGPWQDFKSGLKSLENAFVSGNRDLPTLGAMLARLDAEPFPAHRKVVRGTRQPLWNTNIWGMSEGEGVVYACTAKGFTVLDASSPLTPLPLPQNSKIEFPGGVRVGRFLVSAGGIVLDISNPREPRPVGRGDLAGQEIRALDSEHVVTTSYWDGLRVYRLSGDGQSFTSVGALEGGFHNCLVSGGRGVALYHTPQNRMRWRLRLLDFSNPQTPRLGDEIGERDERPVGIAGSILLTVKDAELRTYDLSQSSPRPLGRLKIPDFHSLQVHGNLILAFTYRYDYRAGTTQSLSFVDISRPHDPRKVGEVPVDTISQSVRLGNVLWLGSYRGLHVLDITDPARAQFIGQLPSASTLGYMKRRGRRLLRVLAESDAGSYVELAAQVLQRSRAGKFGLDFNYQWIEADILIGAGLQWRQTRHGRGPIVRRPLFWRRRRLERASGAWDGRLDLVRELASAVGQPWQTQVVMRRILAANGQELEPLSAETLESILWGDWPFAAVEAAREAEPRVAELSARGTAALLWNVNPRRRREILQRLGTGDGPFSAAIGSHLATLLGRAAESQEDKSQGSLSLRRSLQAGFSRRAREVALLLAARCDLSDSSFDALGATGAIPALLGSNEAPLRNLGLDLCRRMQPQQALGLTALLPRVPVAVRESFIEALCMSAARGKFSDAAELAAWVRHSDAEVRSAVWRLIAVSKTGNTIARQLWTGVLHGLNLNYDYTARTYRWQLSSYLESALNTPAALDLLARCGALTSEITRFGDRFWGQPPVPPLVFTAYSLFVPPAEVVKAVASAPDSVWSSWKGTWLRTVSRHPKWLGAFWGAVQAELEAARLAGPDLDRLRARTFQDSDVAATFAGAAGTLPPALLLQLIGAVADTVWELWRGALLETLRTDTATRAAFWNAARTVGLESPLLRARLVDDAEMAATFGLLEGDALDFDDPALETLLLNWLEARRDSLGEDDLARAAIHPLPAVRRWGLTRLSEIGMGVPLALRLLESGLRDAIDAAKTWFEAEDARRMLLPASAQRNPLELILALVDSPHLETRAYGREFLAGPAPLSLTVEAGSAVEEIPLEAGEVRTRLDIALARGLTQYLQENPNAEMQSYIAELLLTRQAVQSAVDPAEFDRAVLRSRYRARKAKSLVQQRRTESVPLQDERTLLELARGRTPRDAEWAWTQLARRAQEAPVEGVEVSGVGGI